MKAGIYNTLKTRCFVSGHVTDGPVQTTLGENALINDVDAQRENHVLTVTFSGFKVVIKLFAYSFIGHSLCLTRTRSN